MGVGGGTVYLMATIYYYRVVSNMKENTETAVTKFFLNEHTVDAFKLLAVAGMSLVLMMLAEIWAVTRGNPLVGTVARIMYILPMLALAYFPYLLQKITRKQGERKTTIQFLEEKFDPFLGED